MARASTSERAGKARSEVDRRIRSKGRLCSTEMRDTALRLLVALGVAAWSVQVLAVAVFAVGDRYSGGTAVFMSLVVLAGGFLPVALLLYLFREPLGLAGVAAGRSQAMTPGGAERRRGGPTNGGEAQTMVEAISEREMEVLTLLAAGRTNKEIALSLSVTVATVKTHTNNINRKLGTRTRSQAVARARNLDLI